MTRSSIRTWRGLYVFVGGPLKKFAVKVLDKVSSRLLADAELDDNNIFEHWGKEES